MTSLIGKLLPLTHVIPDLDVTSKKRVFEQVGLMLENSIGFGSALIYDALFARERLGSTGLGHGVAVPHGRIKGLREAVGAFVRTHQPIPFEAPDGHPVSLIFVLLVPVKAHELHLKLLSALAEMFSDADLRQQLSLSCDPAQLHELITRWSPHAPDQHRAAV